MADVKISGLPASTTPLDGTEVLPIVQGTTTKQVSITNVTAGRAVSALSLTSTTTGKVATTMAVGNATPAASGAGVTFPATQSASTDVNTLDDYEEGTWTPSIGGNATYTIQTGTYTKIGRLVTAIFDIEISVIGTGSTTLVSGLPFTSSNTVSNGVSVGYFAALASSAYAVFGRNDANQTTITFGAQTAANANMLTSAVFKNGTRLVATVTYFTA